MRATLDAVIVGAGAAGMSLALHLARAGWGERVVLVDPGARRDDRRAWAWWSRGELLVDGLASTAQTRMRVAGPGWDRRVPLAPYGYRTLTGPALADAVDAAMRPGWERLTGTVVGLARDDADVAVHVETRDGETVALRARHVFDSAGVGALHRPAPAWLDFHGLHVEAPTGTFAAGTVTLMDFRTSQDAGVTFVYVLPTSPTSALVERTVYCFPGSPRAAHAPHLERYVREVIGLDAWEVAGDEAGTIPLDTRPAVRPDGPVVPIGAAAGMVRASTGYGFARIQRHSRAIADLLTAGGDPARASSLRRWPRMADDALLRAIRTDPAGARRLLAAMLARNPAERTLAFLDDDLSVARQARLFATLPLGVLARAQLAARAAGRS